MVLEIKHAVPGSERQQFMSTKSKRRREDALRVAVMLCLQVQVTANVLDSHPTDAESTIAARPERRGRC